MAPEDQSPKLKLEFSGDAFVRGRVPINVVASKLQALQSLVYHAAAAVQGETGGRRGLWYNNYRDTVELSFASSHHSDLTIEAELAPNEVLSNDFDAGRQAIDLLFEFGDSITQGKLQITGQLSRDDRQYLLRAYESLMPNTTDQYQISLQNCNAEKHPKLILSPETRQQAKQLSNSAISPAYDVVTLVGELIRIHIDAGGQSIMIAHDSREIECHYPDSLRDQIASLMAGSTIEVTGLATLNPDDQVLKINEIIDVDTVSFDPLRISRFEHNGKRYNLKKPVSVNVEYGDGLWVYSNSQLNLWGYSERREQALRDLHDNFDYLYREIAEEEDHNLDAIALKLKETLRELVDSAVQENV